MKKQICKSVSNYLNKEMEYAIYGHDGIVFLVFPSQDGRFYDFEDQGMVDSLKEFIEEGLIQLFCVDSYDANSFSNPQVDLSTRASNMDAYYHYITEEFIPRIHIHHKNPTIYTTGCSMGGYHALNFLLRRPDLFKGCIGLSGAYDLRLFFEGEWNEIIYENSIVDYLEGMRNDHPFVKLYQRKNIILCSGKGAWEDVMQKDLQKVQSLFFYKKIPAFIDFWGNDVEHDWVWWRKQLPYFVNMIIFAEKD